jgi:hypothetical protein
MKTGRFAILPISLSLMAGLIGFGASAHAQSQATPSEAATLVNVSGPKKPVHKLNEVPTTDSVVLLGAKWLAASPGEGVAPGKPPAEVAAPVPTDGDATAETTAKKAAEIVSLEKQIRDNMIRITLLMRLFVNDEKPFIVDPANPKGDEATQDRRKYEQDELLWETAELAKLKARLNAITAAK